MMHVVRSTTHEATQLNYQDHKDRSNRVVLQIFKKQ